MKLVILFLAMLIANPALAVTCLNDYDNSCVQEPGHSTAGDCEDLGYSKTIEENCEHTIVCPFNSSYKRCVKLEALSIPGKDKASCADLGFTSTSPIADCKDSKTCIEDGKTYYLCGDFAQEVPTCAEKGFTLTHKKYGSCFNYSECTDKTGTHYRCDTPASCGSMGFFENPVPNCDEDDYETCVENGKTYYLCNAVEPQEQKSCSALGFTADNKSSWCNNIVTCDNLSLCASATGACYVHEECNVGDFVLDNDMCSTLCLPKDMPNAKVVGIVATNKLVISQADLYFFSNSCDFVSSCDFSSEDPYEACVYQDSDSNTIGESQARHCYAWDYKISDNMFSFPSVDGYENTKAIANMGALVPKAIMARKTPFDSKKEWFIPSESELTEILKYSAPINKALEELNKLTGQNVSTLNLSYVSSTPVTDQNYLNSVWYYVNGNYEDRGNAFKVVGGGGDFIGCGLGNNDCRVRVVYKR